jgi:hypothetical protein
MATEKQWMRTLTVRKRLADGFPNPTVPPPSANGYPKGGGFQIEVGAIFTTLTPRHNSHMLNKMRFLGRQSLRDGEFF